MPMPMPMDSLWTEIPVPPDVWRDPLACLSDHGSRPIWGEGNPEGRVMIVLDNPGAREDSGGRPFACGTRQTLRRAVLEAGLNDSELYITYLLKRRPRKAYDREQAWTAYLPLLHRQIEEVRPAGLVCMGNTVVQALFGSDCDVKGMRGRSHAYLGVPTVITYHPLAARRRPQLYPLVVDDLSKAAATFSRA